MPRSALTGTRIRERRILSGMRQAELARRAGISASYLNLIEHNRRRVGPDVLASLARALGVGDTALAEGAGAALLDGLRDAAVQAGQTQSATPETGDDTSSASGPSRLKADSSKADRPETDRIEEFASRFPGWAALVVQQQARLATLERTLERVTDRMTHDPFLSASLHEVLSAASSVRSTAAILYETDDISPEWRARFLTNLNEDSRRLAEGAQALVGYLDAAADAETSLASPQEELEAWLAAESFHIAAVETPADPGGDAALVSARPELASGAARKLALAHLARARADARALPLSRMRAALAAHGLHPARLMAALQVPPAVLFRRLATLPPDLPGMVPCGLVVCDGSGTLTFRKPLAGFGLPRFGAACPLWPLYQALARPLVVLADRVVMAGRLQQAFRTYAVCEPQGFSGLGQPQVLEATMLILPSDLPQGGESAEAGESSPFVVGTSCRICARADCPARREPSIVEEAR